MTTINLFCAAGMSTSLLVNKMRQAAADQGLECSIDAFPEAELPNKVGETDVALLGPQVQYRLKADKEICDKAGVPIAVIPMVDYGTMNGKKVLEFALGLKK